MTEVYLVAEDDALEKFVAGIVHRVAGEEGLTVRVRSRGIGGWPRVLREVKAVAAGLRARTVRPPDLLVVAVDANCKGVASRRRLLEDILADALPARVVHAIADPHVERWFLLDGAAFRDVVGHGCSAPDAKCEKERYKRLLIEAVRTAGVEPLLGGIEFADDLARSIDLQRAGAADDAFRIFVGSLRAALRRLAQRTSS